MGFVCLLIDEWSENQVDVIGHDDDDTEIDFDLVVVKAWGEGDLASWFGQGPSLMRAESYEVGFGVALQVREVAAVEGFEHA